MRVIIFTEQQHLIMKMNPQQNTHPLKVQENRQKQLMSTFLQTNKSELSKLIQMENISATVVPEGQQFMPILGQMIRNGQLVSFPTETVYGLGADATNEKALLQIYRVKKRPLTDPIIVHVLDFQAAMNLAKVQSESDKMLFKELTQQFWPGPLTVIVKANLDILPAVVTAQTGFVGIRSPKAPIARKLIEVSQRPIGAPSANLFSHVSPTSAVHVFNDFYDQQITIVDGEKCEYGVESTVVKIVDGNLQILRQGSFSTKKLTQFINKKFKGSAKVVVKKKSHSKEENINMEAPGQLLKHYAPYLPCFYLEKQDLQNSKTNEIYEPIQDKKIPFSNSTLLSFSKQFNQFKSNFKFFLEAEQKLEDQASEQEFEEDKFCTMQEKRQMRCLYHLLRKAENMDTEVIIIGWNEEKQGTLWDKIYRATQGERATIF